MKSPYQILDNKKQQKTTTIKEYTVMKPVFTFFQLIQTGKGCAVAFFTDWL